MSFSRCRFSVASGLGNLDTPMVQLCRAIGQSVSTHIHRSANVRCVVINVGPSATLSFLAT